MERMLRTPSAGVTEPMAAAERWTPTSDWTREEVPQNQAGGSNAAMSMAPRYSDCGDMAR